MKSAQYNRTHHLRRYAVHGDAKRVVRTAKLIIARDGHGQLVDDIKYIASLESGSAAPRGSDVLQHLDAFMRGFPLAFLQVCASNSKLCEQS